MNIKYKTFTELKKSVKLPVSQRLLKQQLLSAYAFLSTCRWRLRCEMYSLKPHGKPHCIMCLDFDDWRKLHYERMEQHYIKIIRAKMKIEMIKNKMGELKC